MLAPALLVAPSQVNGHHAEGGARRAVFQLKQQRGAVAPVVEPVLAVPEQLANLDQLEPLRVVDDYQSIASAGDRRNEAVAVSVDVPDRGTVAAEVPGSNFLEALEVGSVELGQLPGDDGRVVSAALDVPGEDADRFGGRRGGEGGD